MKKLIYLFVIVFILSACKKHDVSSKDLPAGVKFSSVENLYDLVYGGSGRNDDELSSGMVADAQGNVYVSMNVTNTMANKNIIVVRVNSDGTLAWAKQYDSGGNELSPDSGENGETGGTAGSISIDTQGYIYVVGEVKNDEIGYAVLIMKINPSDGSLVWKKYWKPSWPAENSYPTANQDAEGYAVDATGTYLYITGTTGTNQVIVLALNKSDGSIVYQKGIDVVQGTKDRGYAIRQTSSGDLFIGGVDGSYAFVAKVSGGNTTSPSLAWVKYPGLSYGARINEILVDQSGVYYCCDIRGANTSFAFYSSDFNGSVKWAKVFTGGSGDNNNTHVIYLDGDNLWVGGRIGISGMDLLGDALLVKANKTDGSLQWAGVYYTGKEATESTEQRIKGIAIVNSNVYVAGQIYPTDQNDSKYYGEWVESKDWALEDMSLSASDVSGAEFVNFDEGEVRDANITVSDYYGKLVPSKEKKTTEPPDCDVFLMKIKF